MREIILKGRICSQLECPECGMCVWAGWIGTNNSEPRDGCKITLARHSYRQQLTQKMNTRGPARNKSKHLITSVWSCYQGTDEFGQLRVIVVIIIYIHCQRCAQYVYVCCLRVFMCYTIGCIISLSSVDIFLACTIIPYLFAIAVSIALVTCCFVVYSLVWVFVARCLLLYLLPSRQLL